MVNNDMANAIKIAVVEEQIKGLREQQASHAVDTRERFNEMDKRFDLVQGTLDDLTTVLNKGKGAYAVLFMLSGLIGAGFIKFAGFLIGLMR